ncbi:hypothetical protein AB0K68_52605, partial [Streptomyces sp. NPDC050698]
MTVQALIEDHSLTPLMAWGGDSLNRQAAVIEVQAIRSEAPSVLRPHLTTMTQALDLAGIEGRALGRLIRANAIAGRIVIEHGGTDTSGASWSRTSVIPATLAAVRDQQDYNAWVRLVLNPQRADFECATDRQRIELSVTGVGFAPR